MYRNDIRAHEHTDKSTTKLDFKINIKNFGPVSKGHIHLKPLTIFIGPNNSGKSYVATLIHSIISAQNKSKLFRIPARNVPKDVLRKYDSCMLDLYEFVDRNREKQSFKVPLRITRNIHNYIVKAAFNNALEYELNRNFGGITSSLIRNQQKTSHISISNSSQLDITLDSKLKTESSSKTNTQYEFRIDHKIRDYYIVKEKNHVVMNMATYDLDILQYEIDIMLMNEIASNALTSHIPKNSHYFPAARSGILQGHKALSASIIQSATFAGIQSFSEIPQLSGTVSDFISNIITMNKDNGLFSNIAKQLEKELFHGHITLSDSSKNATPEIKYTTKNYAIPLHRTSSTISEIAPVTLYLKHIVNHNSLLIIEEPEAHLHPANQIIFAKYIVKMIRAGLNIIITTHSVFLLEQLGKYILAGKIDPKIRNKKLPSYKEDFLLIEDVSPYVFVKQGMDNHCIDPIEMNDEEGISQEEFVKVTLGLHDETLKLQKYLQDL